MSVSAWLAIVGLTLMLLAVGAVLLTVLAEDLGDNEHDRTG